LTKYIEKAGTGTVDMYDNCRKAGLKPPKFRLENGFFILTVWRKQVVGKVTSKSTGQDEAHDEAQVVPVPTQSSTQSTDPVIRLLKILRQGEFSAGNLRPLLKIKHRPTFRENYLHPALKLKLIEYTIPDKPNSRLQKYRLTRKGADYLKNRLRK